MDVRSARRPGRLHFGNQAGFSMAILYLPDPSPNRQVPCWSQQGLGGGLRVAKGVPFGWHSTAQPTSFLNRVPEAIS
jgi:hypothetical protein